MPLRASLLLRTRKLLKIGLVVLLLLDGADGANFQVVAAEDLTLGIEKRVDMKTTSLRPARELTKPEDELLLQFVGEVILSAEEDNSSLRDWSVLVGYALTSKCLG